MGGRKFLDTCSPGAGVKGLVAARLALLPQSHAWMHGYDATFSRRPVYYVALTLEGVHLAPIRCVATARSDVLLGRNVLNRFIITLDGTNLTFTMRAP